MLLLPAGKLAAQEMQMPAIPVDKNVKVGHLDNGLTYYIRHNNYPEHVASFYIAQKVGSINEDDDQRGLAHLLEHLAFNGTDHFKDNTLQEYLQGIGVEYGRNLNAYTSVEQTVYYFTDVPTTRQTAVDSCMLILKDWSNGITLTQKAIDDERDIVHNEYRMRMVGQQRMLERDLPQMYQNGKYGYRLPIGLMSVIDGCKPETLRAYYRKWYRPDNQAIIIVGDVDVDHIEAQIKKLFGGIKVPANAAKVEPVEVADNDTAIYIVDKDKEQQYDLMMLCMKHEAFPKDMKSSMAYLGVEYMNSMVTSMLNARFAEKAQEPACPYLQASSSIGDYMISKSKGAFDINFLAKPGQLKDAYAAVLREVKRVDEYGFTATEYLRARDEFISRLDKALSNKDKMKNEQFTTQYVDNFLDNEPIPSVEDEVQLYKMLAPNIPVQAISEYAKQLITCSTDTNYVAMALMREADGAVYPTTGELAAITKSVRAEKVEAYVDNVKQEPLLSKEPKAGKIKKTTENKALGYKELTLSNGAKVRLKKTDFKDDEIRFSATANVGYSALDKADYINNFLLGEGLESSGLGNFSNNELDKALAGKQVSVSYSVNPYSHGLSGVSTPKDIETMMQLLYLKMTSISKDQNAFDNVKNTYVTVLANKDNNPNLVYSDSIQSTLYLGSKMARIPSADELKTANYDRILEIGKQFFYHAGDFTFYFAGNFDEATLLPLIEKYIASLPATTCPLKNKQIAYAQGEVKNIFTKKMGNPQSQASEIWQTKLPFSLKTNVLADVSARLLEMKYLRTIREELSAAYHAGATYGVIRDYDNQCALSITASAQLNPEKAAEAIPYFFKGLDETVAKADDADLQKVKEILIKQAGVDAKTNGYWIGVMANYDIFGVDTHTDYVNTVRSIDASAISAFLKNTLLKSGNHVEVIMKAEKE